MDQPEVDRFARRSGEEGAGEGGDRGGGEVVVENMEWSSTSSDERVQDRESSFPASFHAVLHTCLPGFGVSSHLNLTPRV